MRPQVAEGRGPHLDGPRAGFWVCPTGWSEPGVCEGGYSAEYCSDATFSSGAFCQGGVLECEGVYCDFPTLPPPDEGTPTGQIGGYNGPVESFSTTVNTGCSNLTMITCGEIDSLHTIIVRAPCPLSC